MSCSSGCRKCRPVVVNTGGGAVDSATGLEPIIIDPTTGAVEVGLRYAAGSTLVTFSGSGNFATADVTFPAGMFTTPPIVTGNKVWETGDLPAFLLRSFVVGFASVDETEFAIYLQPRDGVTPPAGSVHVHWQAFPANTP